MLCKKIIFYNSLFVPIKATSLLEWNTRSPKLERLILDWNTNNEASDQTEKCTEELGLCSGRF